MSPPFPPNGHAFLLNPTAPPTPTIYPHARIVPLSATHATIYISGIACRDLVTGSWTGRGVTPETTTGEEGEETTDPKRYRLDIRAQTAATLRNIEAIIRGATGGKGGLHNVVDAVVYLTDMQSQYDGMNEAWNRVWTARESAPARATIGVRELPDPRLLVEVKCVAVCEI